MKTIAFYGTCPSRSRVTLVSRRIGYAYSVREIRATFPSGCLNLLQLSFFVGMDDSAPSASAPGEHGMLAENGQVDYVVGEGVEKRLLHSLAVDGSGSYLKVHGYNQDFYDHAVDVQMTIEPKEGGG